MKLDNYPYEEYGALTGRVASKSSVPKNREYTILIDSIAISATGKLVTSIQKEIP